MALRGEISLQWTAQSADPWQAVGLLGNAEIVYS